MNDLLIKLRQQLNSMIEEIDSYNIPLDDTIFIKKEDLKWIKYLGKLHSYVHVFEYKNGAKFTLWESESAYSSEIYSKLLNGTLEILILNKLDKEYQRSGYLINYKLEDPIKTKLRNLYSPSEVKNEGDVENHND